MPDSQTLDAVIESGITDVLLCAHFPLIFIALLAMLKTKNYICKNI